MLAGAGLFPALPALATVADVIGTTQQPASAVVGASIADQATVTGFMPTGTVTFDLYSSATTQNSSTLLFTDIGVFLLNGEATSGDYTTSVTGTDYWVDTYSGDSNNVPVMSDPMAEPVTITATSPSVPEPSSLAIFSFALSGAGIAAWMRRRRAWWASAG